jgi:DNA invertase Pin-like site-specific DNA recombinase
VGQYHRIASRRRDLSETAIFDAKMALPARGKSKDLAIDVAAREGYEVLEEVKDSGQSGARLERPGMDRVRDLVAAGGVSIVLAQDQDRFAREPAYHYLLRREFEEHGCKLRALNDRSDESPEGELTDGILSVSQVRASEDRRAYP